MRGSYHEGLGSLDHPGLPRYGSSMAPRILLLNPPVYDFSAYDFWLKAYGQLRVAGFLRDLCTCCWSFRAGYLIYRFALGAQSERETINHEAGAKRQAIDLGKHSQARVER